MEQEKQIIECVPNFSEGRDMSIVKKITDAIESVEGVQLLNVDPGEAANRTVVTFVGDPHAVVEAAFRGAKTASEVIDMRKHHGTHPRIGATDVLPLIPIAGISLEECAVLARQLARRMAEEAGIPCYAYEASAFTPERRNLAVCRAGEYESIPEKLKTPAKRPDFMPPCNADGKLPIDHILHCGCSVVGARDYLIAINWNLNTTSAQLAHEIACDVRQKGRPMRDAATGAEKKDENGKTIYQPGTLRCTKAIGWYIDEYGIAQVSMNITDINVTPIHKAYLEVCRCAEKRGVHVTGTEIIGLVPKRALMEAGKYFLNKYETQELNENTIMQAAVEGMGLSDLRPFLPKEKVIEYLMKN